MINKIVSKLIRGVLLLEIHLRGPRIKNSAWRQKIIASKYIQSHCVYPIRMATPPVRVLADIHRKVAYLIKLKAAYTSISRTFFQNDSHREAYNQWIKEKHVPNPDIRPLRYLVEEYTGYFPLDNLKLIRNKKGWSIEGRNKEKNFELKNITSDEVNSYFVFTFVRNPFSKFISFFQHFYFDQNGKYHVKELKTDHFFWLHQVSSLSELAYKISKLSNCHLNPHIFPQYLTIDSFQASGGKIDFIGKYESLKQDFEPIRQRFNLLPLEHQNKSEGNHRDWRDYYTPKTAKMVYQRFRKDFERFGYQDEYPKLLDHLNNKAKMRTL